MKHTLLLLFFFAYFNCTGQRAPTAEVTVDAAQKIHPIQPFFWGTNFLFWIEDDTALAERAVEARLKEINIKLLRYPGGTVADNFHWKTNLLDNVHMFPFQEGESESDFDEFMQVCRRLGAEPSVVVNTESWAVKNDLPGGAHEAAEWLRYCKKRGYKVKFWEIGNETYWHAILSAAEYARVVNIYADSLKSVDPDIIIGANGHWDVNMVGTKDRFKKDAYQEMLSRRMNIGNREDFDAYKEFVDKNKALPITEGETKWWETVIRNCGHNIDMIIVHWYFSGNQLDMMSQKLQEVKTLFHQSHPGKSVMFNISEYNTTKSSGFKNDEHLYLAEAIGEMMRAGVDIASFWPMRMKGIGKSTLLHIETDKPSIIARIHQHLTATLNGHLVKTTASGSIQSFASAGKKSCTVVLSGRRIKEPSAVKINLGDKGKGYKTCSLWRISGNGFDYRISEEDATVSDKENFLVEIAPLELVIAEFK